MNRKLSLRIGWISTVLITSLLIGLYFPAVVKTLNTTIFTSGGDGLKSYYCYLYHIKTDSTELGFEGMNYPYGESIFFTDNQPFLSECMRMVCKVFPNLYDYSIAVWNGSILISIVLAALLLYLILVELGLPVVMSVVAGIGIAMLSPQIMRMGAHYSLSYLFVIPMAIFLLLKFSKQPKFKYSIIMGCLVIWSGATHMYYIAFLAMLVFLFWLTFALFSREVFGKWKTWLPHIFIQLILPVVIFEMLVIMSDHAADRGQYPYGFLYYRAYAESDFLPAEIAYGAFLHKIINYNYINWEGFAYIGAVAGLTCAIFFGRVFPRLFKGRFRTGWMYDNNLFLTYLFWGSFLILLYSFGIPFILGLEGIVDYIGPIRQIRGLGRFAWVFYYSMNILAFYSVWRYFQSRKNMVLRWIVMSFALLTLLTEAHLTMKFIYPWLNKKNPEFLDFKNTLPQDQWVKEIDPSLYQSIISLPFFHVGSENIWLEPDCRIDAESFKVSLKTGLPLHAVMMGRTSLSQTYKGLEMIWEPYREPAIFNDLKSSKPILVLSAECDRLGPGEKLILQHTRRITSPGQWYNLGEISLDTLRNLAKEHAKALYASKNPSARFDGRKFMMPDSTTTFIYRDFSEQNADSGYLNPGTMVIPWKIAGRFLNEKLPVNLAPGEVTVSFWLKNIQEDNMPRVELEIDNLDSNQNVTRYNRNILARSLKQIDGSWGLIEFSVPVAAGESVGLALFSGKIKHDIIIDDLLIRKTGTDVYGSWADKGWVLNNRFYPLRLLK